MVPDRIMSKDASSPKEHPITKQHMLFPTDLLQLSWKLLCSVHLLLLNTELIKFETFKEVHFEYFPEMTDPYILDSLDFHYASLKEKVSCKVSFLFLIFHCRLSV